MSIVKSVTLDWSKLPGEGLEEQCARFLDNLREYEKLLTPPDEVGLYCHPNYEWAFLLMPAFEAAKVDCRVNAVLRFSGMLHDWHSCAKWQVWCDMYNPKDYMLMGGDDEAVKIWLFNMMEMTT